MRRRSTQDPFDIAQGTSSLTSFGISAAGSRPQSASTSLRLKNGCGQDNTHKNKPVKLKLHRYGKCGFMTATTLLKRPNTSYDPVP
jgi:hypothetical protein